MWVCVGVCGCMCVCVFVCWLSAGYNQQNSLFLLSLCGVKRSIFIVIFASLSLSFSLSVSVFLFLSMFFCVWYVGCSFLFFLFLLSHFLSVVCVFVVRLSRLSLFVSLCVVLRR